MRETSTKRRARGHTSRLGASHGDSEGLRRQRTSHEESERQPASALEMVRASSGAANRASPQDTSLLAPEEAADRSRALSTRNGRTSREAAERNGAQAACGDR